MRDSITIIVIWVAISLIGAGPFILAFVPRPWNILGVVLMVFAFLIVIIDGLCKLPKKPEVS